MPPLLRRYFASGKYVETTVHGIFHLMAVLLAFMMANYYLSREGEQKNIRVEMAGLNFLSDEMTRIRDNLERLYTKPTTPCSAGFVRGLQNGLSPERALGARGQTVALETSAWRFVSTNEAGLLIDDATFQPIKAAYYRLLNSPAEAEAALASGQDCEGFIYARRMDFVNAIGALQKRLGDLKWAKQRNEHFLSAGTWRIFMYVILGLWLIWFLGAVLYLIEARKLRLQELPHPAIGESARPAAPPAGGNN